MISLDETTFITTTYDHVQRGRREHRGEYTRRKYMYEFIFKYHSSLGQARRWFPTVAHSGGLPAVASWRHRTSRVLVHSVGPATGRGGSTAA